MYKKETCSARAHRRGVDVAPTSKDCEGGIRFTPIPQPSPGRGFVAELPNRHGVTPSGRPRSFPVVSGRFASNLAQFQHSPVWYRGADAVDVSVPDVTAAAVRRRGEEVHDE